MLNQIIRLVFLFLFSLSLTGCITLNSHQTGRTVGKGNHEALVSFNTGKINSDIYHSLIPGGPFYVLEIGDYHGITDRFDVGGRINSSNHFTLCGKFQFLGNHESTWASSGGIELGGGLVAWTIGMFSYSAGGALYNSLHLGDNLALTFSPKVTFVGFTNFAELDPDDVTTFQNIYGYSTGVIFGQKHQISLEFSQYINSLQPRTHSEQQFSIAYIIKLGKL